MTLNEYLAAEGLSTEEIAAVVGNDKQARAMTKALGLAEEGRSSLTRAQEQERETQEFWTAKTTELQKGVERLTAAEKRAAKAEARSASKTAYLKSLAEQNYDVPKEMYEDEGTPSPQPHDPGTGKYITEEQWDKRARSIAPDLVRLNALSNEYHHLYGTPYLTGEADMAEAGRANKPIVEYVKSKYKFAEKQAEKDKAAEDARINAQVEERYKAKEKELSERYGSHPEARAPMPSRFDRLAKTDGFAKDSWKSEEGRAASRAARAKRFENVTLQ